MESEKVKNVSEDVLIFLEANPEEWFTNEQLAEKLNFTPSAIRNAIAKVKGTNLIKSHLAGPLAYRAWHLAPDMLPESQRKIIGRNCNGCSTQNSRYWRSDLDLKVGWLCNNCGMNQRRGKGVNRVNSGLSSQLSQDDYTSLPNVEDLSVIHEPEEALAQSQSIPEPTLVPIPEPFEHIESVPTLDVVPEIAPSAEPATVLEFKDQPIIEDLSDESYNPSSSIKAQAPNKRKPPHPSYVDPSKRKCAHCQTTKSAGKWRRDREMLDRYLCNKCGMNQRRTQMRMEQQREQQERLKAAVEIASHSHADVSAVKVYTRAGRQTKCKACSVCQERLPCFVADCTHRICGECVPQFLKEADKVISCPCCPRDSSIIPINLLGDFFDALLLGKIS